MTAGVSCLVVCICRIEDIARPDLTFAGQGGVREGSTAGLFKRLGGQYLEMDQESYRYDLNDKTKGVGKDFDPPCGIGTFYELFQREQVEICGL